MSHFIYEQAFDRNIGWITSEEMQVLKTKRVAIAGLGGVGGYHLLTLLRLGITKFNLAEMDEVELINFNRQACAAVSNLGKPKIEVMEKMGHDINPDADFQLFPDGVNEDNIDSFLEGADIYVDGLDFFALDIRQKIFRKCREKGIPAITAAPLGMGASHLNFLPHSMSFDDYFCIDGMNGDDKYIKFLIGLSPSMLQKGYLADKSRVNFADRKAPSTPMACEICAGIVGTEVLKVLLGRSGVKSSPHGYHFDAYRNTLRKTWRPWGNKNPLQIILYHIVRKIIVRSNRGS